MASVADRIRSGERVDPASSLRVKMDVYLCRSCKKTFQVAAPPARCPMCDVKFVRIVDRVICARPH